ncbi:MAG: hypothetical protein ACI3XR_08695 [Eubacteriales bacterium]
MDRIMDYDRLFNEKGEQANIFTDCSIGGNYHREESIEPVERYIPVNPNEQTGYCGRDGKSQVAPHRYARRTPVRYLDFDTFDDPDQSREEAMESFRNLAILFASAITVIVAALLIL